jgi:hypothetical protein
MMALEAVAFDSVAVTDRAVRLHYRWKNRRCTYRIEIRGRGLRPPDPALAFRVGLAFAPYLSGFLSPNRLVVRAGALTLEEVRIWERWYTLGLAEKCYRHGLPVGTRVRCASDRVFARRKSRATRHSLLMNGGGKDSAVAAELLKRAGLRFRWLGLNESRAQRGVRAASGVSGVVTVEDGWETDLPLSDFRFFGTAPVLLYLDFVGLLVAEMSASQYLVVGNEKSADFGNLTYRGVEVNHQYTKSHGFETEFARYAREHLGSRVEFYSVLRPLYELQIAAAFARLPQYHRHFVSCNIGQAGEGGEWCGRCSKCAFTFLALYPFLGERALVEILGRNVLEDRELLPTFLALAGFLGHKPFECVGVPEEALAAVFLSRKGAAAPLVLRELRKRVPAARLREAARMVMANYDRRNLIPEKLQAPLEAAWLDLCEPRRRRASPRGDAAAPRRTGPRPGSRRAPRR